jgi:hemerythrin-like metal-binding protein
MKNIKWTKDLQLGIAELDAQHKDIIKTLADIAEAVLVPEEKTGFVKLLKKARDQFAAHFTAEERYMNNSIYPDTAGHKVLHGEFMEEFEDMASRAMSGENGGKFAAELKENVGDWFILHIKKNDIKLASYIIKKKL